MNVIEGASVRGYSIDTRGWGILSSGPYSELVQVKNDLAEQGSALGAEIIIGFVWSVSSQGMFEGSGQPALLTPLTGGPDSGPQVIPIVGPGEDPKPIERLPGDLTTTTQPDATDAEGNVSVERPEPNSTTSSDSTSTDNVDFTRMDVADDS